MNDLIVPAPLAKRIYAIAEEENRPIETVLAAMVENYIHLSDDDELAVQIMLNAGIKQPLGEASEPPLTEQEEDEVAERVGKSGRPLSEIVIEERQEGY